MGKKDARPGARIAQLSSVMGPDVNAVAGGLLRDLAFVQESRQKEFGYKRAAAAVFGLERPLSDFVAGGTLTKLPGIGPASTRVILEVLATGASPTVDAAVAASSHAADIERRRQLRTHFLSRAAVLQVLAAPDVDGVAASDYRGDLQMHSEWSDGVPSLPDIAQAAIALGWSFAAVTDHSHGLKIAGGMSMEDARAQHAAIDSVNAAVRGTFRLIKGIEANIDADGNLDLSAEEASVFELVLAAPHSKLRLATDQTARMRRAIENPATRILAHPRGRISGSRGGVVANWDAIFERAADEGVAVEIDGDPARQDLDYTMAARAHAAGCLFALDSDAHTTDQFSYIDTALAHARLASIPADRIVNCWPLERLQTWLADRRSGQT
jgi:histidinol phosphatase-like PHP family hydrolase